MSRKGLARTLRDTTCLICLQERANQIAGWRWTNPHNAEDVAYLTLYNIKPTIAGEEHEDRRADPGTDDE